LAQGLDFFHVQFAAFICIGLFEQPGYLVTLALSFMGQSGAVWVSWTKGLRGEMLLLIAR
jgi:hypothetical protein